MFTILQMRVSDNLVEEYMLLMLQMFTVMEMRLVYIETVTLHKAIILILDAIIVHMMQE